MIGCGRIAEWRRWWHFGKPKSAGLTVVIPCRLTTIVDTTLEGEDMTDERRAVTVQDAARALGISPDAIRARIRRGTLDASQDAETGRYTVHLPEDARPAGAPSAHDVTAAYVRSLERTVEDLREDKRLLSDQVRALQQQNIELTRAILPPPTDEDEQQPGQGEGSRSRSWLSRIFGGQ